MGNNRIIILGIIITVLGAGYYFFADFEDFYQVDDAQIKEEVNETEQVEPEEVEPEVVTPPPLRGPVEETQSVLSVNGVVSETNMHRSEHGLSGLSINSNLTRAAEIKVDDMFARQYFEHESPTGEGPAELAQEAGYEYIMVGENLALGNYENDKVLVQAWMDSPGHRENILNGKYTEIGVAVKRGTYEGRDVWMAVQEFGRPASSCPKPSESLSNKIDENKNELSNLEAELEAKREEIENMRPRRGPAYERKVDEYERLVDEYNALVGEIRELVSIYNNQVDAYNLCIK